MGGAEGKAVRAGKRIQDKVREERPEEQEGGAATRGEGKRRGKGRGKVRMSSKQKGKEKEGRLKEAVRTKLTR